MNDRRFITVFGTRPEAIKMFPVVRALRDAGARPIVALTAQHREMLDQVVRLAGIEPDHDLDAMRPNQSLDGLTARLIESIGALLDTEKPERVIVQGDTTSAFVAALAAYYRKIPVAHVEAGLRSGNIHHPWPEEVNRKAIGTIADLHFAPTETAAAALRAENVPDERIFVTGNTVIDALFATLDRIAAEPELAAMVQPLADRFAGKRIVAVTAHRRENFGAGIDAIADAVADIARREDCAVIMPLHPNPNAGARLREKLGHIGNVALTEPLGYPDFVRLLQLCDIVLTDSGGVQEEAPALGKPVLVMRETTERPEGVEAGTARLVGAGRDAIAAAAVRLLDDSAAYEEMARATNPYGDGAAAPRIARILLDSNA